MPRLPTHLTTIIDSATKGTGVLNNQYASIEPSSTVLECTPTAAYSTSLPDNQRPGLFGQIHERYGDLWSQGRVGEGSSEAAESNELASGQLPGLEPIDYSSSLPDDHRPGLFGQIHDRYLDLARHGKVGKGASEPPNTVRDDFLISHPGYPQLPPSDDRTPSPDTSVTPDEIFRPEIGASGVPEETPEERRGNTFDSLENPTDDNRPQNVDPPSPVETPSSVPSPDTSPTVNDSTLSDGTGTTGDPTGLAAIYDDDDTDYG